MFYQKFLMSLYIIVAASAASAQMRCESALGAYKSEAQVISFIETKGALRGGEYNAYVLKYFEANLERLSPTGAIHLINAVVPEGPMSKSSQFTAFVSKDYAREKMIRTFIEHSQERLTENDVKYLSDLLQYSR